MFASSLGVGVSRASLRAPHTSGAPTHGSPATCTFAQLRTSASTNHARYPVGATVHVRAVITNVSSRTCSVVFGGTSPTFSIYNAVGKAQWSYCSSLVRPEMCPQYLRVVTLTPRARFSATNVWQMTTGSSTPAPGMYRLHVTFLGAASPANAYFRVEKPKVVTDTQSGGHVTLRVGQLLTIELSEAIYRWSAVQSSLAKVLVEVSSAPVTFKAQSVGTATLRATGTPTCYPQCLMPSRLFVLTVTVRH